MYWKRFINHFERIINVNYTECLVGAVDKQCVLETLHFMLCRQIIALFWKLNTINAFWGQNVELFNIKPCGLKVSINIHRRKGGWFIVHSAFVVNIWILYFNYSFSRKVTVSKKYKENQFVVSYIKCSACSVISLVNVYIYIYIFMLIEPTSRLSRNALGCSLLLGHCRILTSFLQSSVHIL